MFCKNKYTIFLFLIIALSGYCQQTDTTSINLKIRKADKMLEQNTDSALNIIRQTFSLSKKTRYVYGFAKSNLQMVRYYMLKGQNDSASLFTPEAIKFSRISKDTALIINAYLLSSRALSSALQYNKALELCLQAQRFAESNKNNK